jgi:hypothetical protein
VVAPGQQPKAAASLQAVAGDDTGTISLKWFNFNPLYEGDLAGGQKGDIYR